MAESDTPPVPAGEATVSGKAAAPERGVQLDVDKMISSLMSYKNDPGKQVRTCCALSSLLQLHRRLLHAFILSTWQTTRNADKAF